MTVDDCYRELGVTPDASDAEIKAAWRKLAARWHPDRNPSPQALRKTQRINQALEEIRRIRREEQAEAQNATEDDPTPSPTASDSTPDSTVDQVVELTLEDIATGCTRELRGELAQTCSACEGSGRALQPAPCPSCAGAGRVNQPLWFAWMGPATECSTCEGQGTVQADCPACAATGRLPARHWHCRADLPAGLRAGSTVTATAVLDGGGTLALRLRIQVLPHALFTADPDGTLSCTVPVDGFAWMAERWVDVPTARGLQQMRLRRNALKYRIKGGGLPWQDTGSVADCLVQVTPLFPQTLSAAQVAAIETLVAGNTGDAGTEAGRQMADWHRRVKAAQAGQARQRATV